MYFSKPRLVKQQQQQKLEWFWPLQDGKLFFLHLEIMPSKEPQKEPSLTDEWCHYSIGWINA